ncbi:nickel-binding protein [Baekduia sp. Peel2402]|uniref:nickel-binding protein n=1 Tax=Baekduia sp. Peel2402 TaxID=3458296 RepID=UPI00403EDDB8
MPRFLLERTLGDITSEELDAMAAKSSELRDARYPQITWEHTHVVQTDVGLKAFCIYASLDAESIEAHSAELGMPIDRLHEVMADLAP